MRIPGVPARRLLAAAAVTAALLVPAVPAIAGPPVEHDKGTFIDEGFSAFLTDQCHYPVTVTLTERDTFVDPRGVSVASVHIRGTVVGNGTTLLLQTDSSDIAKTTVARTVGLVVKVENASGKQLTKIAGQLVVWSDGTSVSHGQFPEFSLCTYLG